MKIGPAEIGILASIGKVSEIQVFKKPRIGLVSTGNELLEAHEIVPEGKGKIRDSNTHMILSILHFYGYSDVKSYGIIRDTDDEIDQIFEKMMSECDLLITSGGVSMGEKDLIKPFLE